MTLLSGHRIFETEDVDEGGQFACQLWERNRTVLTEGRYASRWNQIDLDKTGLAFIAHDCSVNVRAEGPLSDYFRVCLNQSGSVEHALNGRSLVSDERNAIVHAPGIDLRVNIKPSELLLVSLSGDFVRSALARRFDELPSLETWIGALPSSVTISYRQTRRQPRLSDVHI